MPVSVYEFQQLRNRTREMEALTASLRIQLEKTTGQKLTNTSDQVDIEQLRRDVDTLIINTTKTDKDLKALQGQRLNTKATSNRKTK